MDGPNFNAVLIAFFGTLNVITGAVVTLLLMKNNSKLNRNTRETIKAKDAARQAVEQTNGGLEPHVRQVLEKLKAEESAARVFRIVKEVEEASKERPKLHEPDKA